MVTSFDPLRCPRLPVELYDDIVIHLKSPRDAATLSALVKSSKVLYRVAIRELYRSVSGVDCHQINSFFERLALFREPGDTHRDALATYVLQLTLVIPFRDLIGTIPSASMKDGLLSLHNLRMLEISPPLDEKTAHPPYKLSVLFKDAQFKLNELNLGVCFYYTTQFEQFLNRHSQTLEVLQLWNPAQRVEISAPPPGSYKDLHTIAAPAYFIHRFLQHNRPKKICNTKGYLGAPTDEGKSAIVSYKETGTSCVSEMTLSVLGRLRFVQLFVRLGMEVFLPPDPPQYPISDIAIEYRPLWPPRIPPRPPRTGIHLGH